MLGLPQIVRNGGPADIKALVSKLGKKVSSTNYIKETLSTGVSIISKPSDLNVPPWQMVSAVLGGVPLRTATWWMNPKIPTTTDDTPIGCWADGLGTPKAVEIATTGRWNGTTIGLTGGPQPDANHAKIGVSLDTSIPYSIFGDLNQQGSLSNNCKSSQNGRGGTFFILNNQALFNSITNLLYGNTAPTN